jgi:hypothetical protein
MGPSVRHHNGTTRTGRDIGDHAFREPCPPLRAFGIRDHWFRNTQSFRGRGRLGENARDGGGSDEQGFHGSLAADIEP